MKTRVMITGMAGFLGRHFAQWLREAGCAVRGVDDFSFSIDAEVGGCLHAGSAEAEGIDPRGEYASNPWGCDVLIHAAAMASEHWSNSAPSATMRINIESTRRYVTDALKQGCRRVVLISSCAVYGRAEQVESATPQPIDPYGGSKWASEVIAQSLCDAYGAECVVLRLHNVFGPGQVSDATRRRSVIAIWMEQAWLGEPLSVVGTGHQIRSWCYVESLRGTIIDAVLGGPEWSDECWNAGSGYSMSVAHLVSLVAEVTGARIAQQRLPERVEAAMVCPSMAKIITLRGTEPVSPLRDQIAETWAWYQHWRSEHDLPAYRWPKREV